MCKPLILTICCVFLLNLAIAQPATIDPQPVTEDYYGVKITDPYRNIENLEDPKVEIWMKAQADYARKTLDAIPGRKELIAQMAELDHRKNDRVRGIKITNNDRYFYYKTRPQDQQSKLYYREGYKGKEILLFDPEAHENGKQYAINVFSPSWDGTKVALSISEKGQELGHIRIIDVHTGELHPEKLERSRGISSWLADGNRFTYLPLNNADIKDPSARLNTQTLIHEVGTPQAQDKPVFSADLYPDLDIKPEQYPILTYDKETDYIYGIISTVDNRLHGYYAPASELNKPKISWKPLFMPEQEAVYFTSGEGAFAADTEYIYFSSVKSGGQQILRMPINNQIVDEAEVWIPEGEGEITTLEATLDGLYFVKAKNGVSATLHFMERGSKIVQNIDLPRASGTIGLQTKTMLSSDLWIYLIGWTQEWQRYRYDAIAKKLIEEPLSSEATYPEFADLVVEEIMVPSHDGVMVPLSLVYKKGTPRDGSAPLFMEGYGAYGVTLSPFFFPPWLLWTTEGGILACAHVRGGGELGEAWHRAGMKTTKPNTWKDFIACAEYLVENKYTSPQKIAISGGSAGGILIGRAMTERPDLFAATLPNVGSLNAVRGENSPNGPVNVPEFGTVKDSVECLALIEMDAYLHLNEGEKYPATLVTAGFNDPRVIAWQPAKFAARLQAVNASDKPILFFTDYEAGHGMGDAKQKQFENLADMLAFGLWQTGHPEYQPVLKVQEKR